MRMNETGVIMAEITPSDVDHVAGLAQLRLTDAARTRLTAELAEILTYMDKLNELDTDNVEPMMHVLEIANVLREDRARPSIDRAEALANAPDTDGEYFLVPRILDVD
jgi:aspartyl-tRNA(Asn)/glutamyl-tRNA(Gln) amidotransferase subunit C